MPQWPERVHNQPMITTSGTKSLEEIGRHGERDYPHELRIVVGSFAADGSKIVQETYPFRTRVKKKPGIIAR